MTERVGYEVFHAVSGQLDEWADEAGFDTPTSTGWYYWPCHPGCLPDAPPEGPFESRDLAVQAAPAEGEVKS